MNHAHITRSENENDMLNDTQLETVTGGGWKKDLLIFEGVKLLVEAVYEAVTNPGPAPYNVQPDGFVG